MTQIPEFHNTSNDAYDEKYGKQPAHRVRIRISWNGRSIFNYVQKAKDEQKTILATIVGERPSQVPENIGVFVIEKGRVKK